MSQHHACMKFNLRRRKWVSQRIVDSVFRKCSDLGHLIFYGPWTNMFVRSQNGQNLVTNVWRVWSLIFTTHVNSNNIVVWEIQPNNVDLDCFKTLLHEKTLKIQNPLQEVHYVFLEVIHLFQLVRCVTNRLQFCTALQSWNHFSRCRFIHGRFSGLRWLKHLIPNRTEQMNQRESHWPSTVAKPNLYHSIPIQHTNVIFTNIDYLPPNSTQLCPSGLLCVYVDNEAVIQDDYRRSKSQKETLSRTQRCAAMMNLSFSIATRSSTTSSPIASKSPEMPRKPDSRITIYPNSFDAASTSKVRQKDAYHGGLMEKQRRNPLHQQEEDSEDSSNPEVETWYYKGKLVTAEPVVQNSQVWV